MPGWTCCFACRVGFQEVARGGFFRVFRGAVDEQAIRTLLEALPSSSLMPSASLVGDGGRFSFGFHPFSPSHPFFSTHGPRADLDAVVAPVRACAGSLFPHLRFNGAWVQRYLPGDDIRPHADPRSYAGVVFVAVFGSFEGADLVVEGSVVPCLRSGDVVALSAHLLPSVWKMPLHAVAKVTGGVRHSVILNAHHSSDSPEAFTCARLRSWPMVWTHVVAAWLVVWVRHHLVLSWVIVMVGVGTASAHLLDG